jgi:hypothetical protein
MSDMVLKIVSLSLPFLFSLIWFGYWAAKIYRGPKRKDGPRQGRRDG